MVTRDRSGIIYVSPPKALKISSVTTNKSSAPVGTPITWTARTSDGTGTIQYCIYVFQNGKIVQRGEYGSENTYTYTLSAAATYTVRVYAKDSSGTVVTMDNAGTVYATIESGDYAYTLDNSGNATIISYTGNSTTLTIPPAIDTYPVKVIGNYAFSDSSLISVSMPNSITTIGHGAFSKCRDLTSITIPSSVTTIENSAFANCSALTGIIIPNSVTTLGTWAFENCYSLSYVDFPSSVIVIGGDTFKNCRSLTSITIPNGITNISTSMFSGCSNLTEVTIPNSITNIQHYAFTNCPALTDVYYSGMQADWNNISIGSGNDPLLNATIHFSS